MFLQQTIVLFAMLLIAVHGALNSLNDTLEAIGNLPLCAQSCITSAFSSSRCSLIDFDCSCHNPNFSNFVRNCTQSICSSAADLADTLNIVKNTCPRYTSPTSTMSTTTSADPESTTTSTDPGSTTTSTDPESTTTSTPPYTTYCVAVNVTGTGAARATGNISCMVWQPQLANAAPVGKLGGAEGITFVIVWLVMAEMVGMIYVLV